MKNSLPTNHGLKQDLLDSPLVHRHEGQVSITNAQYAGLEAGCGRGESLLLVAPTSSGKTEVGLVAMTTWLRSGDGLTERVVYLVSHRALARQKFNEFREKYLDIFGISLDELVMATGDGVIDGAEFPAGDPLNAPLVIATYEKFLAMLAGSGLRENMTNYCIIADEVQIVADRHRGQDIEVLLTLIRKAGYGQFVGLSATLEMSDARNLSDWLGVALVPVPEREVPLVYELWTPEGTYSWSTDTPDRDPDLDPSGAGTRNTIDIVEEVLNADPPGGPIAVFCMSKGRVEDLAREWVRRRTKPGGEPVQLDLPLDEETRLSNQLGLLVAVDAAVHSADLVEDERALVEEHLERDALIIVFATTTLAQGLNFSFRTVIFDDWTRPAGGPGQRAPIPVEDFHNMAGRAGRLGRAEDGRVIFVAERPREQKAALRYLTDTLERRISGSIDPDLFDHTALQLVAAEIVQDEESLVALFLESLSAFVAGDRIRDIQGLWREKLAAALATLQDQGLLVPRQLKVTKLGRAVARSGLLPRTATYFVDRIAEQIEGLSALLPQQQAADAELDGEAAVTQQDADLAFVLVHLCLTSPEYGEGGLPARRFIPWMIDGRRDSDRATRLESILSVQPWRAAAPAVNAADIIVDWMEGVSLADLEDRFRLLRGGTIREIGNNTAAHLSGLADVLFALAGERLDAVPPALAELLQSHRVTVGRLVRRARVYIQRVISGVPEDILWLREIADERGRPLIARPLVIAFHDAGITRLDQFLDRGRQAEIDEVLRRQERDARRSPDIREGVQNYRTRQTAARQASHMRRVKDDCQDLVERFYATTGTEFEGPVGHAFECVDITIVDRDEGHNRGRGFPDFVLEIANTLVVAECKSKENNVGVSLTGAREVAGKAAVHGLGGNSLVTICQPYVAPEVPRLLENCTGLTVVNAEDLAEAILRLHQGRIDHAQFLAWLTTPGQPRIEDLPL